MNNNDLGSPFMPAMRYSPKRLVNHRSSSARDKRIRRHSIGLPTAYPGSGNSTIELRLQSEERNTLETLSNIPITSLYFGFDDTSEELACNPLLRRSNTTVLADSQSREGALLRWSKAGSDLRRRRNRAFSDDDFEEIMKGYSSALVV